MHLTPQELDKLMLHQVGFVAQKRLARGLRLNYPEAVGLIASQLLEFIREGYAVAELMDVGRRFLGHAEVMPGVGEMIDEVQIEGTFPDGSKLVTVHQPIVVEHGDLHLALYGSFLPVPPAKARGEEHLIIPGALQTPVGELILNAGRPTLNLVVNNSGDRPIQVGSHYHFIETNPALQFDRLSSYGMRLDIPAGTAIRFEPGESKTVPLVAIGGKQIIRGGNNFASGPVNAENRERLNF